MGKKCFGVFQLKDTDRLTAYINQIIIESERDAKPDGEAER